MALNDDATLLVQTGHFYKAPVGTALPADLSDFSTASDWAEIGHTSLSSIIQFASDGGDETTLGTLQNKALRVSRSPRTESFTFTLEQWDQEALQLYYGSNATVGSDGQLTVPTNPIPTSCAFVAVFEDSGRYFAVYAPKCEIFRGDDMEISDTETLAGLSLKVTPLVYQTNTFAYTVTPQAAVAP